MAPENNNNTPDIAIGGHLRPELLLRRRATAPADSDVVAFALSILRFLGAAPAIGGLWRRCRIACRFFSATHASILRPFPAKNDGSIRSWCARVLTRRHYRYLATRDTHPPNKLPTRTRKLGITGRKHHESAVWRKKHPYINSPGAKRNSQTYGARAC